MARIRVWVEKGVQGLWLRDILPLYWRMKWTRKWKMKWKLGFGFTPFETPFSDLGFRVWGLRPYNPPPPHGRYTVEEAKALKAAFKDLCEPGSFLAAHFRHVGVSGFLAELSQALDTSSCFDNGKICKCRGSRERYRSQNDPAKCVLSILNVEPQTPSLQPPLSQFCWSSCFQGFDWAGWDGLGMRTWKFLYSWRALWDCLGIILAVT